MKRVIASLLAAAALFCAGSAGAYTITTTEGSVNIGGIDIFRAKTTLDNSSPAEETKWVQGILGTSFDFVYKNDNLSASNWYTVEPGSKIYALDLQQTPDYFVVKVGNTSTPAPKKPGPPTPPSPTHYLFENTENFSWAVLNLADLNITEIAGIGKISHVDEYSDGTAPVPEPGTMMLLGAGFLGLAIYGKRRNNA